MLRSPREAISEAASVGRELWKRGPQTCCGAPSGCLCGTPVLRPHLTPAESEPRGWGTARWGLTRPPLQGIPRQAGMLSVWMRPAGRVSPGVGGGAWGLQSSPTLCPRVLYKEDPFLGVKAGEKGLGAYLRNNLTGRNAEESPLLKEARLPGADKCLFQLGERVSTSPLVILFRD